MPVGNGLKILNIYIHFLVYCLFLLILINAFLTVLTMHTNVVEMEKENLIMKKEIMSLRSLYDDAMAKVRTLESMLLNAESVNESLQRKFTDYNNLVDECNAVVSLIKQFKRLIIHIGWVPVRIQLLDAVLCRGKYYK